MSIVLDVEQGSEQWKRLRLGLPTASQFHRILSPTGKPSAQADKYMAQLLAERALGQSLDAEASAWMERGSELEASAVSWWELTTGLDSERAGFVLTDDGKIGCSPDRLVGSSGGLEIKIPSAANHMYHLVYGMSEQHKPQIQGGLMVTGRQWWGMLSWNPELPPVSIRCNRDEEYQQKLADAVYSFAATLEVQWRLLADRYGWTWTPPLEREKVSA